MHEECVRQAVKAYFHLRITHYISKHIVMRSLWVAVYYFILSLSLVSVTACSTVKSVVPGMGDDTSSGQAAGEKLHFQVTPEEAVEILREVASQNKWELVGTGDQFDMHGPRGRFFRLENDRFLGGVKSVGGAFFAESTGCYTVVEKSGAGLPAELVAPFTAAVAAHTKGTGGS
jgi:hypothetical protein